MAQQQDPDHDLVQRALSAPEADTRAFEQLVRRHQDMVVTNCRYITRSPDGTLYVVEYKAGRVARLNTEGKLLGRIGSSGRGTGQLLTPWGIAFRGSSRIVVADTGNRRVVEIEL